MVEKTIQKILVDWWLNIVWLPRIEAGLTWQYARINFGEDRWFSNEDATKGEGGFSS